MAKSPFDILSEILKAAVDDVLRANLRDYLGQAANDIKVRTRLGYGVSKNEQPREKLKPLKDSYITQRQRDKKSRRLSGATTAGKSNLTRSGQMLDAITSKVTSKNKGSIEFDEARSDGHTNSEIADYVSKDRPFLNLSNLELKRLEDRLRKDLTQEVTNRLKKTIR